MSSLELYERRTYDVAVGEMSQVLKLYSSEGWPALEAGNHSRHLVGYFVSDTGPLHQLIHMWRFDSDAQRREFWANLFADETFMAFAAQLRPLLIRQEIQLLQSAPWGPRP
ncbi:MAG: hypothetical protein ACI85J_000273 [Candidatus Poriferisodalaceae bacterium]|jgi:hypothetical protein|nr:NIPSNAP family protein [Acidimicrobiales bacterium]|tara:strand:+ start:6050 stop:6382 length:333 start_codon:yes stop_codon:yes gene_type:complete